MINELVVMANGFLIFAIVTVALFVLTQQDKLAVYVFSLLVILHGVVGDKIPAAYGTLYYTSAALADLAIIAALARMSRPNSLLVRIQHVCKLFIYLNAFGWACFMLHWRPFTYNLLCAALYTWTLVVILRGRTKNAMGDTTVGSWLSRFLGHGHSGGYAVPTNKKATRN